MMKFKTRVIVSALCGAIAATSLADIVVTNNVTLTKDTDWSGEKVVFDPGTSVYLEGYDLKVSDISITNKFMEMEFYETDGNQYFVLPEAPACTDTVEMKLALLDVTTNQCFFCSRKDALSNTYTLLINKKELRMDFGSTQKPCSGASLQTDDVITFRVEPDADKKASVSIISDGGATTNVVASSIGSGSTFAPPTPFWLFRLNTNGTGVDNYNAKCRFYSFKTWGADGKLKSDVVPVYGVAEKRVFLYDRRSKKYLPNLGTADSTGNGYCALDFVDCKESYIVDSGFTPACTNRIEFKARCVKMSDKTQLLFNSRYASQDRAFSAFVLDNGKFRFDYGAKQSSQVEVSFNEDHVFVMSPDSGYTATIKVDGTTVATLPNGSSFNAYKALGVCGGTGGGRGTSYTYGMYGYFYYMKVYASNAADAKLLCELVPAYGLKEKSIGMFDRVAQKFRPNCIPGSLSPSMECAFLGSSKADEGTLDISVAPGAVFTNDSFSIRGKIKVVKDGEGTFFAANTNQAYTGGFVVTNGTVRAASGLGTLFGSAGGSITVAEGTFFDLNHNTHLSRYAVLLNGGTLTNSGDAYGPGDISLKSVKLGADSHWDSSKSLGLYDGDGVATSLDLGGHTLYVDNTPATSVFRLTNTTVTNGTLVVSGDGIIMMRGALGAAYGATLDFKGQLGVADKITDVGDLILRDGCTVYAGKVPRNFSVAGTFKCETANGFPLVYLKPGATWDLSGNEGTFVSVNPLNSSWYVMMADGAQEQTINIRLGDRKVSSSVPIVSWTNTNYTNVTYKLVDSAGGYRLTARADGLYVTSGFVVVIR